MRAPLAIAAFILLPALPALAGCDNLLETQPELCVLGVTQEDVLPSDMMVRIHPPQTAALAGGQQVSLQMLGSDGEPVLLQDARWGFAIFALDKPGLGGDVRLLPSQNLHRALWVEFGEGSDPAGLASVRVPTGLGTHVVVLYAYMEEAGGAKSHSAFFNAPADALAAAGQVVPQLSYAATPLLLT